MQTGILDNYNVPAVAQEAFRTGRYAPRTLDDGVQMYSGQDSGVAFRFFNHYEYNKAKSKLSKQEQYDHHEMIEWLRDRDHKPTEQVRFLPPELLEFDEDGECIGGRYAESYRRFKSGLSAPGTPLSRWDAVHDGHIQTLAANGIFSVEQLAATSRDKIRNKFGKEFEEILDRAVEHQNSKGLRDVSNQAATEMLKLSQENSKLNDRVAQQEAEMAAMREQMSMLLGSGETSGAAKRGRKPKLTSED